jgi:ABC-type thiamine transport system substrate-binding protein
VFAFRKQYTAAHVQALRQYQIQQENYLRAQQQGQQRIPQPNVVWPVSNTYPNLDMSFRQYLQVKCNFSLLRTDNSITY